MYLNAGIPLDNDVYVFCLKMTCGLCRKLLTIMACLVGWIDHGRILV